MATILLPCYVVRAKPIGLFVDFAQNIHISGEIYIKIDRFRPERLGCLKDLLLLCDGKQMDIIYGDNHRTGIGDKEAESCH